MYIQAMNEKLHIAMIHGYTTIYQHDHAPCHISKKTMRWFQENGIEVLDWPGNSPDLNPIENLWRQLKMEMAKDKPGNIQQLRNSITKAWYLLPVSTCRSLVKSMPRRIKSVINSKGFPIKY
jgi:transposase